jgi:retron-type reverse transcriptase
MCVQTINAIQRSGESCNWKNNYLQNLQGAEGFRILKQVRNVFFSTILRPILRNIFFSTILRPILRNVFFSTILHPILRNVFFSTILRPILRNVFFSSIFRPILRNVFFSTIFRPILRNIFFSTILHPILRNVFFNTIFYPVQKIKHFIASSYCNLLEWLHVNPLSLDTTQRPVLTSSWWNVTYRCWKLTWVVVLMI